METVITKTLSKRIGTEVFLKVRYAIVRFMNSKNAFKTTDFQKETIFTLKPIIETNVGKQVQLHLRIEAKDYWNNILDTIDVDVYIPLAEYIKQHCLLLEGLGERDR